MKPTRNELGKIENIRGNFQEIPVQDKLLPHPITLLFIEWIIQLKYILPPDNEIRHGKF